jgi:hypothetical protein
MRCREVPEDGGGYHACRDEVGPMKQEKSWAWEMASVSMEEIARNSRSADLQDGRCACICGGSDGHLCILSARCRGRRARGI